MFTNKHCLAELTGDAGRRHAAPTAAELFIVEGESASKAVCALRDPQFQAVLAMQGKPINAAKASPSSVQANPLFSTLRATLDSPASSNQKSPKIGTATPDCFERVLLLLDPDADGIHCGALLLIYFYLHLRAWLDSGQLWVVRPPLFELSYRCSALPDAPVQAKFAYTEREYQQLHRELTLAGMIQLKTHRTRGLGGLRSELLRAHCLVPETRHAYPLTAADARACLSAFGGKKYQSSR